MRFRTIAGAFLLPALLAPMVFAQVAPCTPVESFGSLSVATFAGTGIPNNAVVQSTCGGNTIGLTTTPRGVSSPPVTNDGVDMFFALAGLSAPGRGLWNFDFYRTAASIDFFKLTMNGVELTPVFGSVADTQDSENIGFAFIGGDPTLNNVDYKFDFTEYADVARTIQVQSIEMITRVGAGPPVVSTPEPGSVALFATGLVGLVPIARRRRNRNAA